jgi:hypothetical protein
MMFPNFFQFKPEHRCESPFDEISLQNHNMTFDQIKVLSTICDQGNAFELLVKIILPENHELSNTFGTFFEKRLSGE